MTPDTMTTCPRGTAWCTDHRPPDDPGEQDRCAGAVGVVLLQQGVRGVLFDRVDQAAVVTLRHDPEQPADAALVEIEAPDVSGCAVLNWYIAAEARAIAAHLLAAADLLDGAG